MPMYPYECGHCKKKIDVLRSFAEYETPPSAEEEAGLPLSEDLACEQIGHSWHRIIGVSTVLKSATWGGKGTWLLAGMALLPHLLR